jgi:hypothetical protein
LWPGQPASLSLSHGPTHPPTSSLPISLSPSPPGTPTCAAPLTGHSPRPPSPGLAGAHPLSHASCLFPGPQFPSLSTWRAACRLPLERPSEPPSPPSISSMPDCLASLQRARELPLLLPTPLAAQSTRDRPSPSTNLIGTPLSPLSPVRTAAPHASLLLFPLSSPLA